MKKTAKFTAKYLDMLIEAAIVDAYNESEQAGGFFAMIEENLALPFLTQVLGQEVTVAKVDIGPRDQIVAICSRGKATQAIPILDLPMPDPLPKGAEWIEAYRRWCGNWSGFIEIRSSCRARSLAAGSMSIPPFGKGSCWGDFSAVRDRQSL